LIDSVKNCEFFAKNNQKVKPKPAGEPDGKSAGWANQPLPRQKNGSLPELWPPDARRKPAERGSTITGNGHHRKWPPRLSLANNVF
jgi:hypothetical protein